MASENLSSRELPYSTEAEKAVLGGIMLKNEAWDIISDLVKEDDFHKEEHKLIYRTINNLQDEGKPVDVITCLLYTSPSPRDATLSRMPSSA